MSEQYITRAPGPNATLLNPYTAGGVSLDLHSGEGALFSPTGDTRVRVDDGTDDDTLAEYFKGTANVSDVLTVVGAQEGTTARNHAAGSRVMQVVSAATLNGIRADISSKIPQSATGASQSATIPLTGWSIVNGAIINDFFTGSIRLYVLENGSLNYRFYTRTIPSSNYTLYAVIRMRFAQPAANSQLLGVYLSDGTKYEGFEMVSIGAGANGIRIEKLNSTTSDNSTVFGLTGNLVTAEMLAVKIVDDGTHRTWYYWVAGAWVQALQETSHTFLTETKAGFGGVSLVGSNAYYTEAELVYWSVE